MGICYELYNHTKNEYTNVGRYAVETKFWVNSPLSNLYVYAIRYYWYHTDNVEMIGDADDRFFDFREASKDITDDLVKQYNSYAEYNENHYHDGTIPKILTFEEYKQQNSPSDRIGRW